MGRRVGALLIGYAVATTLLLARSASREWLYRSPSYWRLAALELLGVSPSYQPPADLIPVARVCARFDPGAAVAAGILVGLLVYYRSSIRRPPEGSDPSSSDGI